MCLFLPLLCTHQKLSHTVLEGCCILDAIKIYFLLIQVGLHYLSVYHQWISLMEHAPLRIPSMCKGFGSDLVHQYDHPWISLPAGFSFLEPLRKTRTTYSSLPLFTFMKLSLHFVGLLEENSHDESFHPL